MGPTLVGIGIWSLWLAELEDLNSCQLPAGHGTPRSGSRTLKPEGRCLAHVEVVEHVRNTPRNENLIMSSAKALASVDVFPQACINIVRGKLGHNFF